jgi:hypothetical protein
MVIFKEHKSRRLVEEDEVVNAAELEQDLEVEADASAAELADAVVAEVELATEGEETLSADKAMDIAQKIRNECKDFDRASWAPISIPSKFTKKLDKCLANARFSKYHNESYGSDLLVTGLPGAAKTAIFKAWCAERGVNYMYINAKDDDLSALINGFSVHDQSDHSVIQAGSKKLLPLRDTPTVIFLDEFNRAPHQLRAQLLTLINEHEIAGDGPNGIVKLHGILFTVACINPDVATDPGAMPLNQAERSRFFMKHQLNSNVPDAMTYFKGYFAKKFAELDPKDPGFKYAYAKKKRAFNIAMKLLTDPRFDFDQAEDQAKLDLDGSTMLNQRLLTDGLGNCDGKEDFLEWVDDSEMSEERQDMIHSILDSWTEPDVTVPGFESEGPVAGTKTGDEDDDLMKMLNDDDEEDVGLFNGTATSAGKAAVVDAATARRNISSFDFSL